MPKQFGYGGRSEGGEGGSSGGGKKGGGRNHDACYDQPGEAFPGSQPAATDMLKGNTSVNDDKSTGPMSGNYVPSEGNKDDKY